MYMLQPTSTGMPYLSTHRCVTGPCKARPNTTVVAVLGPLSDYLLSRRPSPHIMGYRVVLQWQAHGPNYLLALSRMHTHTHVVTSLASPFRM